MNPKITYRALSEFCWNVLGEDPDDVIELRIRDGLVHVERFVRDEQGGLIVDHTNLVVATDTSCAPVVHDGN